MARDVKHGRCSIQLDTDAVTAETGFLLVDISDITNWPHTIPAAGDTAHVEITALHMECDPNSNYRGHVTIGFLDDVRASIADLHEVACWTFQSGGARTYEHLYFYESPIVCDTRYHYGRLDQNVGLFGSTDGLSGPPGGATTFYCGTGDLVLRVTCTAGQMDLTLTICYNIVEDTN